MVDAILKPGREKSVRRLHPWVFSGAIERIDGNAGSGETVNVISSDGQWLAVGAYSHDSTIRIRIWSWNNKTKINEQFLYRRILQAINARKSLYDLGESNACRLLHGESDGIPGLIIDRYDDVCVVQYLSAGPEKWKDVINPIILEVSGVSKLYERSDVDVRQLEGLPIRVGPITQNNVPERIMIKEHSLHYWVDIKNGHKTGFYLDQRVNRLIARSLADGRDVLDCFCYTGGFSLNAFVGKANSVLAVDQSKDALELVETQLQLNEVDPNNIKLKQGDVFQLLREFRDRGLSFDMIILDPPKFAPTISQVSHASRGYKDINLLAMKLLRANGVLMTYSCSGGVSPELFEKIVAGAALDSGIDYQIIGKLSQAADHPVALNFPEGAYLKGLILRRI